MLTSKLGIRMLLWVGKTRPQPAPPQLLQAVSRVEVTNNAKGDDGFQMTFMLTKQKVGEYDLLQSGALDPDTRVTIGVIMGATPEPLIDGVIYHYQLEAGQQPGTSTLRVMGRDVRVMLDLKEANARFPNQPDSVIVWNILGNYAKYGLVPNVTATTNVHLQTDLIPGQHGTDLQYIQSLARRNGFTFYIEPLAIGTSMAYWGPEVRTGLPQPALTHGLGTMDNVQELYVKNDALGPVKVSGYFFDPVTKTSQLIPALPDLRVPPLATETISPRRTEMLRDIANRSAAEVATDLMSRVMDTPDPVDCTGTLDAVRYGYVLRARRLVGLRGVGSSYDGNYYVKSVRHVLSLAPIGYTQEFTLQREGTGSLLPVTG